MITCNEALELLSAQLDGAITIEEQTALQEHLAACPECRRIQRELKMAEEALPELQQEPPKLLHDTVMREIRRETRRKKERKPLLRFVGAIAALLAVLAGFKLVNLPGFDHGEAAVSMGDSLFPKTDSARKYAEELAKQTGCRVILVEHCTPEALGGGFAKLDNGIYRRELSEAELDALETNLDSSYTMIICGAKGEAEDSAYLLCTD